jgi:ABC-type Fe3+/spermidine/putrescine transport system ATPase subunit
MTMREEICKIQQSLNLTVIFVTHDQVEAMSMSDRIVVMNRGQVEQIGTPKEIYERSRSLFTACFIGCINLLEGRILENSPGRLAVSTALGQFSNPNEELAGLGCGDGVTVVIRPEAACIAEQLPSTARRLRRTASGRKSKATPTWVTWCAIALRRRD